MPFTARAKVLHEKLARLYAIRLENLLKKRAFVRQVTHEQSANMCLLVPKPCPDYVP